MANRVTKCDFCGHKIILLDELPDKTDDDAWHRLADQHAAGCGFIRYRGSVTPRIERRDPSEEGG